MKKTIFLFLCVLSSYYMMALEVPFYGRYIDVDSEYVFGLIFSEDGSTILLTYFNRNNELSNCKYKVIDAYYRDYNATARLTIVATCITEDCKFGDINIIGRVGGPSVTRGRYNTLKGLTLENNRGSYSLQGYGSDVKKISFEKQSKNKQIYW